MIRSVDKQIDENGIIWLTVNTETKWVGYMVGRLAEEGKLQISFYDEEENEVSEFIDMKPDFIPWNYKIAARQEKDQIDIFCIPHSYLMWKSNKFKPYDND